MKSQKLISLAIGMLFCLTAFGQDNSRKNGTTYYVPIRIGRPGANENLPLYILDGKFINDKEFQKLKSENIESVKVLKDSVATALYGSRGSNGVIIIETKNGPKTELITEPKVNRMERKQNKN